MALSSRFFFCVCFKISSLPRIQAAIKLSFFSMLRFKVAFVSLLKSSTFDVQFLRSRQLLKRCLLLIAVSLAHFGYVSITCTCFYFRV
jgi:hypothetical protein